MVKMITWGVLILSCAGIAYAEEELVIKHIRPESDTDSRNQYFLDMLYLALEKTEDTEGAFKLETAERQMYQGRAIASLAKDRIVNVIWTMTSKDREQKLLPIRIPLLKGLLGHRIFIIKKEDRAKFAAVKTLDDLKKFRVGQGHDWPDTEILRANGFNVVSAANYDGLFEMLKRGRFDFFSRGANEPWAEIRAHPDMGFAVEETLMLQYTAPIYFFVNKENEALAERLEKGLRLALQDGSFDDLFYNHPITEEMFKLGKLEQRRIFPLKNPLLPPETPVEQQELWYTP
jgi:ABC-type amino acid transport substrate-binding protein